jgi:hypothetical protein
MCAGVNTRRSGESTSTIWPRVCSKNRDICIVHAMMREGPGSVFPGAIAHGLSDVLGRIPG